MPHRPDAEDVSRAAEKNKGGEQDKHPVIGEVGSFSNYGEKRDRNGVIRESNKCIGAYVEPENARLPKQAMPVRHKFRAEKLFEKLRHNLILVAAPKKKILTIIH